MYLSILGLIVIVYTGFNYITTEKVIDIGPIKVNKEVNHPVQWSPIAGAVFPVGEIIIGVSSKKKEYSKLKLNKLNTSHV